MKIRLKPPSTAYRRHVFNADGQMVGTLRLRPGEVMVIDTDDELAAIQKDLGGTIEEVEPEPEPEPEE